MEQDVRQHCNACITCKAIKDIKFVPVNLRRFKVVSAWDFLAMDICGPLPITARGHTHILVIMDRATRFTILRPLKEKFDFKVIKDIFIDVVSTFGCPIPL